MTAQITAYAQVREFTKEDWYGLAGCEAWHNSQPMVGYQGDTMVVADRNGISVMMTDPDGDQSNYYLPLIMTPALAALVSNTILKALADTGMFDAAGLGFRNL